MSRTQLLTPLQAREISITAENFSWNHDQEFVGFPDSVHMTTRRRRLREHSDKPVFSSVI
jgi:hypothetical protein